MGPSIRVAQLLLASSFITEPSSVLSLEWQGCLGPVVPVVEIKEEGLVVT